MSLRKLEYGSNANPGAFRGVIGELPDGSIGRVVDDSGTAFWHSDLNLRIIREISCDNGKEFTLMGTGAGDNKNTEFTMSAAETVSPKDFVLACRNAFGAKNRVGGLSFEDVQKITMDTKTDVRYLKRITAPTWSAEGIPLIPGMELDPDVEFQLSKYTPTHVYDGDIGKAKECLRHMLEFTSYSPMLIMGMIAAPVTARWFHNDRFGLSIFSTTQSFKTSTIIAFMSIYGVDFNDKVKLFKAGERSGTKNAPSAAAAGAGFLPWVYDNLKNVEGTKDIPTYIGLMQAVIEGSDKARLKLDGSERDSRAFLCTPIITGEIKPAEAATSGRINNLRFVKPTIEQMVHLTYIQEHLEDMPVIGYQWLLHLSKISAPDMKYFKEIKSKKFGELTAKHCVDAGRSSTTYAIFKVVWKMLGESVFGDVVAEYDEKFNASLDDMISYQNESVGEETEVERLLVGIKELMASQPSKFPKDEWARPGSNGTDSTPGTIGFIGIQCAEGVFVLPDMVLKALRDMGIFQQIPNKASMGQALAAKGCLKTDHGNQYTKKINTVVTRGWMITKGLFTDKYHRDIPAAPEYE